MVHSQSRFDVQQTKPLDPTRQRDRSDYAAASTTDVFGDAIQTVAKKADATTRLLTAAVSEQA
jgi:hypothetical protein